MVCFLFYNRAETLQQEAMLIFAKCPLFSFAFSFKSKPGSLVYLSGPFLFEFPKFRGQVDVCCADAGLPALPLGRDSAGRERVRGNGAGGWYRWGVCCLIKGRGAVGRRLSLREIACHLCGSALV